MYNLGKKIVYFPVYLKKSTTNLDKDKLRNLILEGDVCDFWCSLSFLRGVALIPNYVVRLAVYYDTETGRIKDMLFIGVASIKKVNPYKRVDWKEDIYLCIEE